MSKRTYQQSISVCATGLGLRLVLIWAPNGLFGGFRWCSELLAHIVKVLPHILKSVAHLVEEALDCAHLRDGVALSGISGSRGGFRGGRS